MIRSPRSRFRAVTRALIVGGIAGATVLTPIQMAQGTPRTRFATLPAGVTERFASAAVTGTPPGPRGWRRP